MDHYLRYFRGVSAKALASVAPKVRDRHGVMARIRGIRILFIAGSP